MFKIDWITSVKPNADEEIFLYENCLLQNFDKEHYTLKVINGANEMRQIEPVRKFADVFFVSNGRPTLKDLISIAEGPITILSNADVRLFSDKGFWGKLEREAEDTALFVSRRYDVEFVHNDYAWDFTSATKLCSNFGYLQSPFTLDIFIINAKFRDHLLEQSWANRFHLGDAGIDMMLLNEAYRFGKVRRIDRYVRLLHQNHEAFKIALPINIVIDIEKNLSFSSGRKQSYSGQAASIRFADLPRQFYDYGVLRRLILMADMTFVRLRNVLQYNWSKINFALATLYIYAGFGVQLGWIGKYWCFIPHRIKDGIHLSLDRSTIRDNLRANLNNYRRK